MMIIITFANHKGGVGKTTTVANIGYALAHHQNKRILMIDMDQVEDTIQHLEDTQAININKND